MSSTPQTQNTASSTPLYHALDGREVLRWALLEAGRQLTEFGMFSTAMTYHNPKFRLTLEVDAYDASGTYVNGSAQASASGSRTTTPTPGEKEVSIKAPEAKGGPAFEPDKVRDSIDAGRYFTKKVGDVLVDVKDKRGNWNEVGEINLDSKKGEKK